MTEAVLPLLNLNSSRPLAMMLPRSARYAGSLRSSDPRLQLALCSCNITPSLIPGGCTSLIQVLDVSVNRPLKDVLRESTASRTQQAKGKKVLDLVCALQPDAAE